MVPVVMLVHLHYYLFILFLIYIPRCIISLSPCGVGKKNFCFLDLKSWRRRWEKGKSPLPAARIRHNIKKFDLGRWEEYTPISTRSCKRRIQCNALLEWLPNNGFQRPKHDSQSNLSWKRCIQCSNVNLWGHVSQHERRSSLKGVPFVDRFSSRSECYLAAYGLTPICGGRS